jgi:hypothetical protein
LRIRREHRRVVGRFTEPPDRVFVDNRAPLEADVADPRTPTTTCAPYRKKTLYLVLTVPYLAILALVAICLWHFSPWLTAAVILSYLWASFFQAYCCACQDCPYIGGFCPYQPIYVDHLRPVLRRTTSAVVLIAYGESTPVGGRRPAFLID